MKGMGSEDTTAYLSCDEEAIGGEQRDVKAKGK